MELDDDAYYLKGRPVWLTSFWGFDPEHWGCVGFSDEWRRSRFLADAAKGALVAIYVTKGRGPDDQRGKVVGILQVNNETGHISQFLSGDAWAEKEADPNSRGKWEFAVRVVRAWRIDQADWLDVEDVFPSAYKGAAAQAIGANGVRVADIEAERLADMSVYEVPVYGQTGKLDSALRPLKEALKPSKAVQPAKEPYFVGEVDGPKYLYVLRLSGGVPEWTGEQGQSSNDSLIVKVGFSLSPYSRCQQIQSAYPSGRFRWEVLLPDPLPETAPYPSASVAIAGEDAMKARLVKGGAQSLGGEFFLAEEWLVHKCWVAGKMAAEKANEEVSVSRQ